MHFGLELFDHCKLDRMKGLLPAMFVVCIGALPARAQLGLALSPMRLEIKISPGRQYTDSVRLSNDSAGRFRVRGEILDWYIDDTMTPQFGDSYPQEAKFSCRDWLQVNPRESDLEAHATTRVRYTLAVPEGTSEGEYHCGAGFVTLSPVGEPDMPMGVRMAVRAVSVFYVTVGKPASKPMLKALSLKKLVGGTWEATALFENQGLKTYRVNGFVEVRDSKGQKIERVEYATIPVLPQRQQRFLLPLKSALAPGEYELYTQADAGLPQVLEASVRMEVNASP